MLGHGMTVGALFMESSMVQTGISHRLQHVETLQRGR